MTRPKKPKDTLEKIVQDAIERERSINEQHPERNGYGMIQGEANDLIHRIEHLEHNQLRAQGVKVKNRLDKIRVIGSDRLYTHSPEDIVIEKIDKEQINKAEEMVLNRISKRSVRAYFLKQEGNSYKNIGDVLGIDKSTACRDVHKIKKDLRSAFKEIYNGGDNYILMGTSSCE